jgi:hypothetical protein
MIVSKSEIAKEATRSLIAAVYSLVACSILLVLSG